MAAARLHELEETTRNLFSGMETCVLEIGCGHGHLLTAYAAEHPEKTCIGIDIIADRITRANRKKNRARLANVHFINTSAEDFFAIFPSQISVSELFIFFPDPWPKRRHHKNRLMQAEFLSKLSCWVTPSSRLYFRTDDLAYFTATEAPIQHGQSIHPLGHSNSPPSSKPEPQAITPSSPRHKSQFEPSIG
jgi:tRNA (guanine-N7-)-methyltransferase